MMLNEISDVYVHPHGDGVGGSSLLWLLTLTERYGPIRDELCYQTDVSVKAKETVTRMQKVYYSERIEDMPKIPA